jgi:hypothetical protein
MMNFGVAAEKRGDHFEMRKNEEQNFERNLIHVSTTLSIVHLCTVGSK